MPKWSSFIRNLGTAGPATLQGIYDLGFALRSEIPALFNKYLRVDAVQTFTSPEKTQGRANLGVVIGTNVQAQDAGLQSLADLTTLADRLPYLTGVDVYDLTTFTAFARTLLDDIDAATMRATLALGNVDNTSDVNKPVSTAQQTALNLKANLASPALTGNPTGPTPSVGDNDTSLATTAFVHAEVPALLNVSGSAPMYACRAWVNFNGTGTVAIRGSGNVSSITDNGVGSYTVNFATAMQDANYAALMTTVFAGGPFVVGHTASQTAGACGISTGTPAGVTTDVATLTFAAFR